MWLTKFVTRSKNHEKWLMSDRGLSLASDSCCSKVMISIRTVSHLLTKIVGEDRGGLDGSGDGVVEVVGKGQSNFFEIEVGVALY